LFEHDLFQKPVPTFPDHALSAANPGNDKEIRTIDPGFCIEPRLSIRCMPKHLFLHEPALFARARAGTKSGFARVLNAFGDTEECAAERGSSGWER
jgi:hypothetical protein